MIYLRLDTKALTNGKLLAAGPLGFALYVKGLLYSKEHMLDGLVPKNAISLLTLGMDDADTIIAALVAHGLWVPCDEGWTVGADRWAEFQQTSAQVKQSREAAAERKRKSRGQSQECHSDVTRDQSVTLSKPEPEPEPEIKKNKQKETKSLPSPAGSQALQDAWGDWVRHRRELRKSLTPTQAEKVIKKIDSLGEFRAIRAIEHSITNGYQGLYEPTDQPQRRASGGGEVDLGGYERI